MVYRNAGSISLIIQLAIAVLAALMVAVGSRWSASSQRRRESAMPSGQPELATEQPRGRQSAA